MTFQTPERLWMAGHSYSMFSLPLAPILDLLDESPFAPYTSSGLRRGYLGCWAIGEDRVLSLTGFDPEWTFTAMAGTEGRFVEHRRPTELEDLFPDACGPVEARWYTGRVRLVDEESDRRWTRIGDGYSWTMLQFHTQLVVRVVSGIAQAVDEVYETIPDQDYDSGF